ncbi:uncharacterized protein LOC111482436 [Cucurbita maxima]|uniref:Uncharacterized protein LOC111482436 n=1 Tax=Cucurbita maxima TaxID=3661 RepID=A0A6J1J7E6_CUCMA|nr:uncharacterized protein LOC111482436 [Cucurbita maxima]
MPSIAASPPPLSPTILSSSSSPEEENSSRTKMELINNVFHLHLHLHLLLALSSLFSSPAIAICVPRNISLFQSPTIPLPTPSTPPVYISQSVARKRTQKSEGKSSSKSGSSREPIELVQICDVTSNPKLCQSSISSSIHESTVNPVSALKTEIEQSIKEVENAIAVLKKLDKESGSTKAEDSCYDTCLENFDMAIEDLRTATEAIDVNDVGRMESALTAVLTDLVTCDDTFVEMGVDSPLDHLSIKMNKYASNCLAISKLLL